MQLINLFINYGLIQFLIFLSCNLNVLPVVSTLFAVATFLIDWVGANKGTRTIC